MNRNLIILILLALVFSTCEMPDRDNPWDEKATIDSNSWSANGLQIHDVTLTSKKISWSYQGDNRIEGFQIDRKIGAGEWQEEVYFAGKDERQWVDTNILPDSTKTYTYRLTVVAGAKKSNERTGTVSVRFPGPTALDLKVGSDTTINVSWSYTSIGHEGFKIDRRKDNETWQEAVGTVVQSPFTEKLVIGHDYFYRVYAYYKEYTSGVTIDSIMIPVLTTSAVSNVTWTTAIIGGEIASGKAITARGVVWSTSQNPTIELSPKSTEGSGIGAYTSLISDLHPGTTYYVRAYATNNIGTGYGDELSFSTIGTVTSITGRIWMDRNLGGNRVALSSTDTESYGDLYQWGRDADGHEKRTSQATSTLSSSDTPGHGKFITGNYDWRSPQNNNLWQGADGTNNPCPEGFRLPTLAEWNEERVSWSSKTSSAAFTSPLKLPVAGYRLGNHGSLGFVGFEGSYWSSSVNGVNANGVNFSGSNALLYNLNRHDGLSVRCIKDIPITVVLPSVTTTSVSSVTSDAASSGGNISTDGGASVTARGVCWSTSQNPTVSLSTKTTDSSGVGTFTSSISGLQSETTYYVIAYATNSAGTAYGNQLSFTTTDGIITSTTGKMWMDRNLGARRVATNITDTEAYGDLFQWGRDADGHEKRTSQATSTLSSSDTPDHDMFVLAPNSPYDWRSPQNKNLWQGVNGTNNPCPEGFRIPTGAEWDAERASWSSNNSTGAFASPLKLPAAGLRGYSNGLLVNNASGHYWSSYWGGQGAQRLLLDSGNAYMVGDNRATGNSVRCIKDD